MRSPEITTIPPPARRANTIEHPNRTNHALWTSPGARLKRIRQVHEPRRSSGATERFRAARPAESRRRHGVRPSEAGASPAERRRRSARGAGCSARVRAAGTRGRERTSAAHERDQRGLHRASAQPEPEVVGGRARNPIAYPVAQKTPRLHHSEVTFGGQDCSAPERRTTHRAKPHAFARAHAAPRCSRSFASPSCTRCCIGP